MNEELEFELDTITVKRVLVNDQPIIKVNIPDDTAYYDAMAMLSIALQSVNDLYGERSHDED